MYLGGINPHSVFVFLVPQKERRSKTKSPFAGLNWNNHVAAFGSENASYKGGCPGPKVDGNSATVLPATRAATIARATSETAIFRFGVFSSMSGGKNGELLFKFGGTAMRAMRPFPFG